MQEETVSLHILFLFLCINAQHHNIQACQLNVIYFFFDKFILWNHNSCQVCADYKITLKTAILHPINFFLSYHPPLHLFSHSTVSAQNVQKAVT